MGKYEIGAGKKDLKYKEQTFKKKQRSMKKGSVGEERETFKKCPTLLLYF